MKSSRFVLGAIILISAAALRAQPTVRVDPSLYAGLRWRSIGPFRAGRVNGVAGVPGQPNVFYAGSVGGGVWKTTNSGRNWFPIFDSQPIASIGAVAVAPSNPAVVYVASGEADMRSQISYGNGIYQSTDAGKTWTHIGLDNTRQIGRILIDPRDPNVLFVAALGHVYGPNPDRGVFKSKDGGRTWQKVLFKNADVGAIEVVIDPTNSKVIYAGLWNTRRPPWYTYAPTNGPGGGIFSASGTTLDLMSSTVAECSGVYGGGISGDHATIQVVNSTVSHNGADFGGGIALDGGSLTVTSSTIVSNTNSGQVSWGPGIYLPGSPSAQLRNSVVALNRVSHGGYSDIVGDWTDLGFNLVGSDVDPMLSPLQNAGGLARVKVPLPGSPLIDRGHSSGYPYDELGHLRPYDDATLANGSGSDGSDIGAVEAGATVISVGPGASPAIEPDLRALAQSDALGRERGVCARTRCPDPADDRCDRRSKGSPSPERLA